MELFGWFVIMALTLAVAAGAWVTALISSGWSGRIEFSTWVLAVIAVAGAWVAYVNCPFTVSMR